MLVCGDARYMPIRSESVQCVVTSPPYWGLRDYLTGRWEGGADGCDHVKGMARGDTECETPGGRGGSFRGGEIQFSNQCGKCGARRIDTQIGLEATPEAYVAEMVAVFREVWRVLRKDGTVWLNLGDSYATGGGAVGRAPGGGDQGARFIRAGMINTQPNRMPIPGLKPKDLVGIPWRVAFALQAQGWYLRSDIIWSKPNPMPESVTDRPTKAHEYVFLLTKSERYYYDADAIREPFAGVPYMGRDNGAILNGDRNDRGRTIGMTTMARNRRSVWEVATEPYSGAHFATFPRKLIEPMILAGTSEKGCCPRCRAPWTRILEKTSVTPVDYEGKWSDADPQANSRRLLANRHARRMAGEPHDQPIPPAKTIGWHPVCACNAGDPVPCIVLDPFIGSGTTVHVARALGRRGIGLDLKYFDLSASRIHGPLFAATINA
jgi:DNA modification methylase